MRAGMLPLLAQECLSRQPPPANEEIYLQWVAEKAVKEGCLDNKGGHDAMHLDRNFSEGQRKELHGIYRKSIQGNLAATISPLDAPKSPPAMTVEELPQKASREEVPPAPLSSSGLYLFIFGIVFVITLIVLAIFFPEPSPFQHLVFRIVLGLAAAGIAASMPGALNITIEPGIKAGGAIAVFIIIYLLSPAQLVTKPSDGNTAGATQKEPIGQTAPGSKPPAQRPGP